MYEPGIIVRKPRPDDLDVLGELILRFYMFNEEFDPAWSLREDAKTRSRIAAKEYLKPDPSLIVLVAEVEGSVVGYIRGFLREMPLLREGYIAVITEFYVHPSHRGRRVGATLIERFLEEAKMKGAARIAAEVPSQNVVAKRFYEKLGFREFMVTFVREV